MALRNGSVFAGYRIERMIGAGGMGTVYLARHPRLPRSVALKVLDVSAGADPEFRARFQREAELAVRLDHPNIVEIYDRGDEAGLLWISMRYVAGVDVAQLIAQGRRTLPPRRAAAIITQAAEGLDAAHRRGLVHRDVKPANILVTADDVGRDQVFVTDFGIARSRDDSTGLTATGSLLATLGYVAPEQIRGDPIDHRADIYALGATLYQMLTGTIPFTRTTPAAMLQAHLFEPPPRPSAADPALPTALDDVIAIAMAKDPEHRYDSCRSLAAAVTRALEPSASQPVSSDPQAAVAVSPPGAIEFAQPRAQRSRSRTTTIVATSAVLIAAVAIALTSRGPRTITGIGTPADATTSTAVHTTTPTTPAPAVTAWGRDNDLVALFTALLPATPADSGYQGARCTDLTVLNNGAAPALECTQDNGIHWYVWSFRRGDPRRDSTFRTNIDNDSTRQTTWTRPSGTGSVRWSYYPGANTGLLTISFDDPARAWVVIDVTWDHHTGQDLYDQWWIPAPL